MPAPWTFIHPACGQPAFHAVTIPRTAEAADALIRAGGLDDIGGRPIPADDLGIALCESCYRGMQRLDLAAMTVEANWRRREPRLHDLIVARMADGRAERIPFGSLACYRLGEVLSWGAA